MSLHDEIKKILEVGFAEDIGTGDVTSDSVIPADLAGQFIFRNREPIIFCGVEILKLAFKNFDIQINTQDGARLNAQSEIARIGGNVREILRKERVVLNLLQHLSGIATLTGQYVEKVKHTKAKILDTRKTLPGLRALQKYAVKCGGGQNHRMGLFDMIMIKDNHIKYAGGIAAAVEKARSTGLKIEIECDRLEQVNEALAAGVDVILADNMTDDELREVVKTVDGKIPVEASGNVSLETVKGIAETGVDFISVGKLTHSVRAVDIGLDEIT